MAEGALTERGTIVEYFERTDRNKGEHPSGAKSSKPPRVELSHGNRRRADGAHPFLEYCNLSSSSGCED